MEIKVLEIVGNGICTVCGHGEENGQTFGWSVLYNEDTHKLVGKLTVSPKRYYIGQKVRRILPALIKVRLAECS
jgi:hypothetical protein